MRQLLILCKVTTLCLLLTLSTTSLSAQQVKRVMTFSQDFKQEHSPVLSKSGCFVCCLNFIHYNATNIEIPVENLNAQYGITGITNQGAIYDRVAAFSAIGVKDYNSNTNWPASLYIIKLYNSEKRDMHFVVATHSKSGGLNHFQIIYNPSISALQPTIFIREIFSLRRDI